MEYKNKFDVLWDVERNETNIFEMVVSKFIKNVMSTSDSQKFGDFNVSETFKNIIGITNYEEFYSKYENTENPYAKLIIELVENLHTLNIYKFESMEEHLCVIEANNNKDLIHGELLSNVDDELASFELTKSLKDKVARIIKDDLERAAQEAENDAKIKDDLDDIGTGEEEDKEKDKENDGDAYENNLATDDDTGEDENPDADEDTKKFLAEAAEFRSDMSKKDFEDASLEDVFKDMKVYDVDANKNGLGKAWSDFKTNVKVAIKSCFDNSKIEAEDIKDPEVQKNYMIAVMVDRTSPYVTEIMRLFLRAFVSGFAIASVILVASWFAAGVWALLYILISKKIGESQLRAAASMSITINAINTLKEMKAKAKSDDDYKKYDLMIDDLMKRQGITERNIKDYEKQMAVLKDFETGSVKVKESITIDMNKIATNIITEIRESNNIEEMDAHVVASSTTLAATIFIVAEMFGLKTKEEIQEIINN